MKNKYKLKIKKWVALVPALCLAVVMALPVMASDGGVPQVVLDARGGVLRIVNEGADFFASGTGFAVGSESQPYIITNYHVVEDNEKLFLFYDTGEWVEGRVYREYPEKDLAVIKPLSPIPDIQVLSLAANVVDSGQAVYALGFPGASDTLSDGFEEQEYEDVEDFLNAVVADTQSMTITNGIISAIRTSKLIGYDGKEVQMVQTNAAINNGNSGGPLLNAAGNVVGVNTIGLSGYGTIEAMNGSIHVDELARVLKSDGIPYTLADGTNVGQNGDEQAGQSEGAGMDATTMAVVGIGLFVVVAAVAVIVVVLVRNRKPSIKREMSLLAYERSSFQMGEPEVLDKVMGFLQELASLDKDADTYALLTPENIQVGPRGITLKRQKSKEEDAGAIKIYPGYSAPESYDNRSSRASSVYFVGAMMNLLLTGNRPENAMRRKESGALAFPNPDTMQQVINEAMETAEVRRIPDLGSLQYRLGSVAANIQYENGYQPMQPTGYQ